MDPPPRPKNVGILDIEVYFPQSYVSQDELAKYDGCAGKYVIGLGQNNMAFASDLEDVNSISLTVVNNLLKRTGVKHSEIGRLEVGTETIMDKSKSTKTILMQLFSQHGNTDIEGIDTTNACYGGTSALLNALNWVEASSWDGRYAIVVAADVAVYEPPVDKNDRARQSARATGGCGAVALLIGPDAPLAFETGLRGTHMEHVYDFYKPNLSSEYPTVDGKVSIKCYLRALDNCYATIKKKSKIYNPSDSTWDTMQDIPFCFHSPYNKLVQKSYARLFFNHYITQMQDSKKAGKVNLTGQFAVLQNHPLTVAFANGEKSVDDLKEEYLSRTKFAPNNQIFQKEFLSISKPMYLKNVEPGCLLAKNLGNSYTASVYCSVASLIFNKGESLVGSRVIVFSYGSGLSSTMFCLRARESTSSKFSLGSMAQSLDLSNRLSNRVEKTPAEYTQIMAVREKGFNVKSYTPTGLTSTGLVQVKDLVPGTFYLTLVNDMWQRFYKQVESSSTSNSTTSWPKI